MKLWTQKLMMLALSLMIITSVSLTSTSKSHAFDDDPNAPDKYVAVKLIADKTQVSGGDTITIGVEKTIYNQWHTYWINAGDSGTPAGITWDAPEGFEFTPLQHPVPKIIDYGPLTNYGHENVTTLIQTLTLPDTLPEGAITLNASVDLLVCHEICIPETHKASLTLNGEESANPEAINAALNLLPQDKNLSGTYTLNDKNLIAKINLKDVQLNANDSINLLPIEWGLVDNTKPTAAKIKDGTITLTRPIGDRDPAEVTDFPIVIAYGEGYPQKGLSVSLTPATNTAALVAPTPNTGEISGEVAQQESNITFIQALLLAIAGGVVLNLMPCVFPVLSMKALSLINLNGKEEKKARAYGLSYTAGILLSFALIAGILIALKSGGAQIGWGFQLQNPIVIIALSYLVFIIGLNLSGLFEFSGRFGNMGQKLTAKSGHGGAFWTGVLATLVATPCTAPFMGAAVGFALTQNAFLSLLVFLGLGFGLALPYLALCYIPALRRKLPRPGAWMESFRQFLSFPMFITAAWLLWVLTQQATNESLFATLIGMISIVFALWLFKRTPSGAIGKALKIIFLVIAAIGTIAPLLSAQALPSNGQSASVSEAQNYVAYSPEKLDELLQGDEAIFINMTAAWCITCKVNEKIALNTSKTRALFAERNIQYLKGDWTNKDPAITQLLNKFNRQGVPLYIYYAPREGGKRSDPVVLPQILTSQIINETISG